jgi:hypothetical protein
MSFIKLAISSAPARLAMQKQIIGQAGPEAGAMYHAASSIFARGDKSKFDAAHAMLRNAQKAGLQRANPALSSVEGSLVSKIKPLAIRTGKALAGNF